MASITALPAPSHADGAGGGGVTGASTGASVGGGAGAGGAVVVTGTVVDVVEVVVLDVEVVVDRAWRAAVVADVCRAEPESSLRPWKTSADAETTATATTIRAPITQPRVPNRPTPRGSTPAGAGLRLEGARPPHEHLGVVPHRRT
jgi:hypothetical protein